MIEYYAFYIELSGIILLTCGWFWLLVIAFQNRISWGIGSLILPPLAFVLGLLQWRKSRIPLGLITFGFMILAFPPAYSLLMPIDLGPRETIVNGERHLTITGWDRKDYSFLASKHDAIVLQMANPDVTDETLRYLIGMNALRELDLGNTQITDRGLKILKDLPVLTVLRLKNTKITDAGFQSTLAEHPVLIRLDLAGTQIGLETINAWRKAKEGRRAIR
jgi:hypothetical protein